MRPARAVPSGATPSCQDVGDRPQEEEAQEGQRRDRQQQGPAAGQRRTMSVHSRIQASRPCVDERNGLKAQRRGRAPARGARRPRAGPRRCVPGRRTSPSGTSAWTCGAQEVVDERTGQLGIARCRRRMPGELDLAEAARFDRAAVGDDCRLGVGPVEDLGGRTGGVRDHDAAGRPRWLPPPEKLPVVGLLPARGRRSHRSHAARSSTSAQPVSGSSPKCAIVASRKASPGDEVAGFCDHQLPGQLGMPPGLRVLSGQRQRRPRRRPPDPRSGQTSPNVDGRHKLRRRSSCSFAGTNSRAADVVGLEDVGRERAGEERVVNADRAHRPGDCRR